jgi:DNA-binding XRE family transcriptional regulator
MADFDQLLQDIDAEAHAEGPAAVAQLRAFEVQFTLAADLIALRKARGLSQKQLARESGVQQADISKIERGLVNPTIGTIEKLARPLCAQVRMLPRDVPAAA